LVGWIEQLRPYTATTAHVKKTKAAIHKH